MSFTGIYPFAKDLSHEINRDEFSFTPQGEKNYNNAL